MTTPGSAQSPPGDEVVEIWLGERCFPARKRLLLEQSDFFGALFRSGMREAAAAGLRLRGGLSARGLELVLDFIHCGRMPPEDEGEDDEGGFRALEELLEAACYLQVTALLRLLASRLRLPNCLRLLRLAQHYGLRELREAALGFMAARFHALLRRTDLLPGALRQQLRKRRLANATPALLALGRFAAINPEEASPCSALRYDEGARRWLPLPGALPVELENVRGYGAALLDNYLFLAGGYRLTASQEIAAAHCYNPSLDEWSPVASMNQKRSNFKLLAVSGKLYAIGGQSLSSVECYDPEHDWWNFVASLPTPLVEFSACECKDKIYVMGGYTTRGRNLNILQYCPISDNWTNFEQCDIHIRKQQMLSLEDTIYIVGGCIHELGSEKKSNQNEDMLTVQSYNITTREWLYLKENTSKSGLNLTCTLHNDGIYILTRDVTLFTSLEHRVFLKYNIFTDSWESIRHFPIFGQNMLVYSIYLPNLSC
ncbi:kelch-like protein 42 [Anolis carolinensis]|uniref:kelch-like protein 42 n=1 Tax=Anolis carolinensis TaxID=28377 RepID=UPI002F2B21AC